MTAFFYILQMKTKSYRISVLFFIVFFFIHAIVIAQKTYDVEESSSIYGDGIKIKDKDKWILKPEYNEILYPTSSDNGQKFPGTFVVARKDEKYAIGKINAEETELEANYRKVFRFASWRKAVAYGEYFLAQNVNGLWDVFDHGNLAMSFSADSITQIECAEMNDDDICFYKIHRGAGRYSLLVATLHPFYSEFYLDTITYNSIAITKNYLILRADAGSKVYEIKNQWGSYQKFEANYYTSYPDVFVIEKPEILLVSKDEKGKWHFPDNRFKGYSVDNSFDSIYTEGDETYVSQNENLYSIGNGIYITLSIAYRDFHSVLRDGLYWIVTSQNINHGLYNPSTKKLLLDTIYQRIQRANSSFIIETKSGKYGLYNASAEKWELDTSYSSITTLSTSLIKTVKNQKLSFYNDLLSKPVQTKGELTEVRQISISESPVFFKITNKWMRYLDVENKLDTTMKFDDIIDTENDYFFAKLGETYYRIHKTEQKPFSKLNLENGDAPVKEIKGEYLVYRKKDGGLRLQTSRGENLITNACDSIGFIDNANMIIYKIKYNKYGLKRLNGEDLIFPGCDAIEVAVELDTTISFTINGHKTIITFDFFDKTTQINPYSLPTLHTDYCSVCDGWGYNYGAKTVTEKVVKTVEGMPVKKLVDQRYDPASKSWVYTYRVETPEQKLLQNEEREIKTKEKCEACNGTGHAPGRYVWMNNQYALEKL